MNSWWVPNAKYNTYCDYYLSCVSFKKIFKCKPLNNQVFARTLWKFESVRKQNSIERVSTFVAVILFYIFAGKLEPSWITGIRQHRGRTRLLSIIDIELCHVREPPWTLICLFRLPLWLNLSKHSLHWYGFSPEWIRRCLVNVELSENAFLQNRHLE